MENAKKMTAENAPQSTIGGGGGVKRPLKIAQKLSGIVILQTCYTFQIVILN